MTGAGTGAVTGAVPWLVSSVGAVVTEAPVVDLVGAVVGDRVTVGRFRGVVPDLPPDGMVPEVLTEGADAPGAGISPASSVTCLMARATSEA